MRDVAIVLGMVGGTLFVSSCLGSITPNVQPATDQIVADVCTVWLPVSFDSTIDSPQTVSEVQAGNRARDAYCEEEE